MIYNIPYSREKLAFSLSSIFKGEVFLPSEREKIKDFPSAMKKALCQPLGTKALCEEVKGKKEAVIVVTDLTRACPDHMLVPCIIEELSKGGLPKEKITIITALGMHRPCTKEEIILKLGAEITENFTVLNHEPTKNLLYLGESTSKVPLWVNRKVAEADFVIATGIVEPHLYAGFSGGAKTVVIGTGGEETIQFTHSPRFIEHPNTRPGSVTGNPFQETIQEASRLIGLNFVVNVILNGKEEIISLCAGSPQKAFSQLVEEAQDIYSLKINSPADVVIAGVGWPKDVNLYQASRSASYLERARIPVVKEGGVIIIPAMCEEGAGKGKGEERFFELLRAKTPQEILNLGREGKLLAGEQRAFMMGRVLAKYRVIVACSQISDTLLEEAGMYGAGSMEEALEKTVCLLNAKEEIRLFIIHRTIETIFRE